MKQKVKKQFILDEKFLKELDKLENEFRNHLYHYQERKYQEGDNLVICYKCKTLNLLNDSWDFIECAKLYLL